MFLILFFQLLVLLFSVILHEISHGYVAYILGDDTAKKMGRLSLNPLVHLDFWGSFLFPLMMYIVSGGSLVFGWAKPVPFNPLQFKKIKRDIGLVGMVGPLTNFIVALFFAGVIQIIRIFNINFLIPAGHLLTLIIHLNLLLSIFNLIPLPPLDGSRILYSFLPKKFENFYWSVEKYSFFLIIIFIFIGFRFILPLVDFLFSLLVG